jgi:hypothetical protein
LTTLEDSPADESDEDRASVDTCGGPFKIHSVLDTKIWFYLP